MMENYANLWKRVETFETSLQDKFEKLQQKLADSHQTFEEIVGHMSDGLIFTNLQGSISLFNPAAEKITGSLRSKLIGDSFWEHFSDTLFGFSMREALTTPGDAQRRILLTLNGLNHSKEIEISASSVPQKGVLMLIRDRTKMQQLEMSALQSDRLKELGEMAATLAHEIRNPLGGIAGFASLLEKEIKDPAHLRMVRLILEGANTLNGLVTNVLDYARPFHLHFASTDLCELVKETLEMAKADPLALPCLFLTDVDSFLVSADKRKLKGVLWNLLRNAFETTSEEILIILRSDGSLSVKDQGPGIAVSDLEKLFTPFFTTKPQGTGLGLADAYKTIQAHGGSLTVDSSEKGTTFTIKLPGSHAD